MNELMANTLPADNQLARDLVRGVLDGGVLTAEQLVATGMDFDVLSRALKLLLRHIENLRGFKPLTDHFNHRYANVAKLKVGARRASQAHLLSIHAFDIPQRKLRDGRRSESVSVVVFLTREGKWYVVDYRLSQGDDRWTHSEFCGMHFEGEAAEQATLHELVEYLHSRRPAGSVFTRPSRARAHEYGAYDRYNLESICLALAEAISRALATSVGMKNIELHAEQRALDTLKELLLRYTTEDTPERRTRT